MGQGHRPGGTQRRRRRPPAVLRRRILVVTEGRKTEPQYVERLQAFLRSSGSTTTVKSVGLGRDPLTVVNKTIELRDKAARGEPFDHCVALVDVDNHQLLQRSLRLAKAEGIDLVVSNVKFEVWLRWHGEDATSQLSSKQLDELMAAKRLLKGKDLDPAFEIEKVEQAIGVARRVWPSLAPGQVGPNPSTSMPYLVDLMR